MRIFGTGFLSSLLVVCLHWNTTMPCGHAQQNWPRWRGPEGDGTAPEANPPVEWSSERNIRWKVDVPGSGSATPIVWDNQIFVLTAIDTGRPGPNASAAPASESGRRGRRLSRETPTTLYEFCVISFDRRTGDELWRRVATEAVPHEGGHPTNTFASGSPVTDGEHLYVSFGSYGIYCFDLAGNLRWKRDLGKMETRNAFGEGSSPALQGDTLIVPWDHEGQSALYALDAKTGTTRWKAERDEPSTWATPLIAEFNGRYQVITNGTNRVRSYDLADGSLIWECGGQFTNPIPTPIVEDGIAYCMTGYQGNAVYAIPLDARGDVTDTDTVLWSTNDVGPYISSAVLYKGQLYVTKGREGILFCLDAKTGEPVFRQQRLPLSTLYASLVAADDRIYITDRGGKTLVIRHGSEFEVIATNDVGETVDASPVLIDDQILLRGAEHLFCIQQQ